MKFATDNTTGLPETPEGYWWRVTEGVHTHYGPHYHQYESANCVFVSLMTRGDETKKVWFFKFTREVDKEYLSLPVRQTVRERNYDHGYRQEAQYTYNVSAETIRQTADSIIEHWHRNQDVIKEAAIRRAEAKAAAEEAKAIRQRFVGDYPPKRLESK